MRVEIDGVALRLCRGLNRRSTASLARAVGVTPAALCHIEMGRRASVAGEVYLALVTELGIESRPDWIVPASQGVRDVPSPARTTSRLPSSASSGIVCSAGQSERPATAA